MSEAQVPVYWSTVATAEQVARAHGAQQGVTVRGGWIFAADGSRLARGWAAWTQLLQQQGVILAQGGGYALAGPQAAVGAELPPQPQQDQGAMLPERSELRAPAAVVAPRSARALLPLVQQEQQTPPPAPPPVLPIPHMPPRPFPRPFPPPRPAPLNFDDKEARAAWVHDQVYTPDIEKWARLPGFTEVMRVPFVLACQGEVPIEAEYVIAVSWHTHSYRSLDGWPVRRTPRYWLVGFHTDQGSECPIDGERSFPTLRGALIAMSDEIGSQSNLRLHRLQVFRCADELLCHDCLIAEVFGEDVTAKEDKATCARFTALFDAGPVEGHDTCEHCEHCERWAREDDRALDRSNQWRREHENTEPVAAVLIRGPGGAPMIREHIDTIEGRMVRDWLDGVLVAQVLVDTVAEARTWLTGRTRISVDLPPCVAGKLAQIAGRARDKAARSGKQPERRGEIVSKYVTTAIERHFTSVALLGEHYATGLAQLLKDGAGLSWSGGYTLADQHGEVKALGLTVRELCLSLSSLDGRHMFKAALPVRVNNLPDVQRTLGAGESLSAYIREALRGEVRRREAEQDLLVPVGAEVARAIS